MFLMTIKGLGLPDRKPVDDLEADTQFVGAEQSAFDGHRAVAGSWQPSHPTPLQTSAKAPLVIHPDKKTGPEGPVFIAS